MRPRARTLAAVATALVFACGAPRLPAPDYTRQPQDALVPVPYPPPPARVEFVPKQPKGDAVWIDGEWAWRAITYSWKPGRWVEPPQRSEFSPWTTVRDRAGGLYLAEGTWRDDKGAPVAEPVPLAVGRPSASPVVTPEGEDVPPSPIDTSALDGGVRGAGDAEAARAGEDLDGGPVLVPDGAVLQRAPGASMEGGT